jgi:hypothetical protein
MALGKPEKRQGGDVESRETEIQHGSRGNNLLWEKTIRYHLYGILAKAKQQKPLLHIYLPTVRYFKERGADKKGMPSPIVINGNIQPVLIA